MNRYIGYFIGALFVVPIGALIAKYATAWVAGFKARYIKVLVSTIVAYVAVNVVGLALYALGVLENLSSSVQMLIGWGALSCSHINLIQSEAGDRLSPGKAMIVAICQILGAVIALLPILWLMLLIKRAFVW